MIRSRLIYLILILGLLCSVVIYKWLPGLVSYETAEKCILYIVPVPSALLLLFWRQYRSLKVYEKLNGSQAKRFNSIKPLIYKRILICFFVSLGSAAIAILLNFIIKTNYEINPEILPTIYLATAAVVLTINLYLIASILFWIFELADFSDQLSEKEAAANRASETIKRLELTESP